MRMLLRLHPTKPARSNRECRYDTDSNFVYAVTEKALHCSVQLPGSDKRALSERVVNSDLVTTRMINPRGSQTMQARQRKG